MQRDFNESETNQGWPPVITDELLIKLSNEYTRSLRNGDTLIKTPNVNIRYVKGRDEFGYTSFRNVFFFDDYGMYVWDKDPRWEEDHNQDLVDQIYGHPNTGRGYAHRVIFAGLGTGINDKNNEEIFTGDVVKFFDDESRIFAVGTLDYGYGCILDNHALMLSEVEQKDMERVGTVFFQLENEPFPKGITERTKIFNGWHDSTEERELKIIKARFTPNFDQEDWKYKTLEIIGTEFNWKK